MKKIISLILALLFIIPLAFSGCSEPDPDEEYNKNASKGLDFTSNGDGTCFVSGIGSCTDETVIIPTVSSDGDNVKSIGDRAFENCDTLKNVTIPHSVEFIGYDAFLGTPFYNDEANWENGVLYSGKYLIKAKDELSGTYEIKSGTVSVASCAFERCSELELITVPADVKYICPDSFCEYDNNNLLAKLLGGEQQLKSVLTSIRVQINRTKKFTLTDGNQEFDGPTVSAQNFLGEVEAGKLEVGKKYGHYDLACVSFSDFDMTGLYHLRADDVSLNTFVRRIFFAEPDGKTFFDALTNAKYLSCGDGTCTLVEVKPISNNKLQFYVGDTPIISDTVTKIGASVFENFSELTHLNISGDVTEIGSRAFAGCTNLMTIRFAGTSEEWKAIKKGEGWNSSTGDFKVRCQDKTLTKAEA